MEKGYGKLVLEEGVMSLMSPGSIVWFGKGVKK
jgi:hypothetical protein